MPEMTQQELLKGILNELGCVSTEIATLEEIKGLLKKILGELERINRNTRS